MSYFVLSVGCLFLLAGVAYLAYLMNIPETYAMGSAIILVCLGVLTSGQTAGRSRV